MVKNRMPEPEVLVYKFVDEPIRFFDNYCYCGQPGMIGDESVEFLHASQILGGSSEDMYIAVLNGDSMCDADLHRGDLVSIDPSLTPHHGDVVLAVVDGEILLKFLHIDDKGCTWLAPANASFHPMKVDFDDERNRIVGVMTKLTRSKPRFDSVLVKRVETHIRESYRCLTTTDDGSSPFYKYIPNEKDKRKVLMRIHNLLDGQEGVAVVKILKAAESVGYLIRMPSQGDLEREFRVTISHSLYYKSKNINYGAYELESYIESLMQ